MHVQQDMIKKATTCHVHAQQDICSYLPKHVTCMCNDCNRANVEDEAMDAIPAAVKESVEKIRASDEPVWVKVEQITQKLLSAGLAYGQTITPKEILVHPANRGGK